MKKSINSSLFPRPSKKSSASPRILALCASSTPNGEKETVLYHEQRLGKIKQDKDTIVYVQNGRVYTGEK